MFDWSAFRKPRFLRLGKGRKKETGNLKWLVTKGKTGSARNRDEANNSGRRTKSPGLLCF